MRLLMIPLSLSFSSSWICLQFFLITTSLDGKSQVDLKIIVISDILPNYKPLTWTLLSSSTKYLDPEIYPCNVFTRDPSQFINAVFLQEVLLSSESCAPDNFPIFVAVRQHATSRMYPNLHAMSKISNTVAAQSTCPCVFNFLKPIKFPSKLLVTYQ